MIIPFSSAVLYILLTLITIWLFSKASKNKTGVGAILLGWAFAQWGVAYSGFYTDLSTMPPRPFLMFAIPVLTMIVLFATKKGRGFIDSLDLKWLTLVHMVRLPVEIFIFYWFTKGWVPELMTFEGRNFDIVMGITAPIMFIVGWKPTFRKKLLLIWNVVGLLLLFNIVIHALLSIPLPFQQLAFDQPNIAVLEFPFNALPAVIVQIVLFSHLVAIRRLWGVDER